MTRNFRFLPLLVGVGLYLTAAHSLAAPVKRPTKPAAKSASPAKPAISPTDPARFTKIKEWKGTLATQAQSTGQNQDGTTKTTWESSIRVDGMFKLVPHYDNRNVDPFSLRGQGEARITVSGKRVTQYPSETTTDTYAGDYIDTFQVEVSNIDAAAGTYQLAVIRDQWQKQGHEGKAIHLRSVTVSRYGTTVREEMVPGHSWADDGGAGFGRNSPLPKSGLVIKGSMTSSNNDFLSQDGGRWNTSWTIQPGGPEYEEPLKAVAGGPYTAERGQTLHLDGWKSTGKVRSYKWSFAPVDEASTIPFNAGTAKDGARVATVFLAPVKATLTVSDGKKEDSETVIVNVKARDYKTAFTHREEEKLHPQSIPPRMIKGRDLRYAGGENVCALDPYSAKDSVHILHPTKENGSWENKGFALQQVQDAGGPFHGVWYLSQYSLQVERETLINKYILPKGPPPVRTAKPFYESNKALGNDVDGYLAAVRKHEMLHSELMQKSLAQNDPGPKVEALASNDKAQLLKQVDEIIQGAEDVIDKASADPLPPVGFNGKIAFPDDATDKYTSIDMGI